MYKSSSAKSWRKYNSRYKLTGVKCTNCSHKFYPPVQICKNCYSSELVRYDYKEAAKLITWSKVSAAPDGFEDHVPYIVAIVELEDGQRLTTQLVDVNEEELVYGMELKTTFRKIYSDGEAGIIHYGLVFTGSI